MKVYSDTLSYRDLREALPKGVEIAVSEIIQRPRKRQNGWIISLTGSSPYVSQMSGLKAATWDEHGLWMAELYRRDPEAVIGHYKTRQQFIDETRDEAERVRRHFPANHHYRKTRQAPWLHYYTGALLP